MTTKWSAFASGGAVASGDIIVGLQGGSNVKWTASQLATFMWASPTLVTPVLGVATGTSIALGGATIGSNALAVTGSIAASTNIVTGSNYGVTDNTTVASAHWSVNYYGIGASPGGIIQASNYVTAWSNSSPGLATPDLILSRASAGVLQVGTTAANALGSLNLTSLTATGQIANSNAGSATAPSVQIGGSSGSGIFTLVNNPTITAQGVARAYFGSYLQINSNAAFAWTTSTTDPSATTKTYLTSPGAGVIQAGDADVASGAVAQTLQVQSNTGTTVNGPLFLVKGAGGGTTGSVGGELRFQGGLTADASGTGGAITFYTAPAAAGNAPALAMTIAANKNVTFAGAISASAVTSVGLLSGTSDIRAGAANSIYFNTRSAIDSAADGVLRIANNAQTDFTRLQFGGTTNAFPSLKRVNNAIALRRADDTIGVFADLPAAASANEGAIYAISDSTTVTWGATVTGGGANHALIYSDGTNWTVIGK